LLIELREIETRKDRIVGSLRERIGDAVKNDHLHKGVFAWIRKLDKMEAEDLVVWLDTLEAYLDGSGLMDRAETVQELPMGGPEPVVKAAKRGRPPKAAKNGHAEEPEQASQEAPVSGGEPEGESGTVTSLADRRASGEAPGGKITMLN
jgi:hypothetical protein